MRWITCEMSWDGSIAVLGYRCLYRLDAGGTRRIALPLGRFLSIFFHDNESLSADTDAILDSVFAHGRLGAVWVERMYKGATTSPANT